MKPIFQFCLVAIFILCSCGKPSRFDKLDRNASQFSAYVEANRDKVQGEWKYFMDNLRGEYVIFEDEEGLYGRFILDNNEFIKTEGLTRKSDTLFVDDPVGKFYVMTLKGNLNVFFENRTITTLIRK